MFIKINREIKTTLIKQVYSGIKEQIITGTINKGEQLPSSRSLAQDLELSRVVVLEAYEQLIAEGYLVTKVGAGTFVADNANFEMIKNTNKRTVYNLNTQSAQARIGLRHEPTNDIIDFRTGVPDLKSFPIRKWGAIYKRVCTEFPSDILDYHNPKGSYPLRKELAEYLFRTRGIVADPEQIAITTGAAQIFTLLARLLLNNNETVVVEDPINCDIQKMLRQTGARIINIPVDEQGINPEEIPNGTSAKLVFTTPSHQFPMGGILPINRRLNLIKYARKSQGYIIEDDYDSAFRFHGSPISSLHSLSPEDVIYVGTFSKILYPSLRIGYVVLPPSLVEGFCNLKHLEDLHTAALEQLTLAIFIKEKHLERHIRNSKKNYCKKNQFLRESLKNAFGNDVSILGDQAGIHLVAEFNGIQFTSHVLQTLYKNGVKFSSISEHSVYKETHLNQLMFGYGHLSLDKIEKGVQITRDVLLTCK